MDAATLAYVSSWASMISLVLTLINTYLILRIKTGIVVNLTLEPILVRLRDNSAAMNQHLSYYHINDHRFFEVAGVCEADVKAMRRRLGYIRGWFLRDLLRSIRTFRRDRSRTNAQEVYASLQQVCQHLANILEEKRITG
jgi:hypothetical protein